MYGGDAGAVRPAGRSALPNTALEQVLYAKMGRPPRKFRAVEPVALCSDDAKDVAPLTV